MTKQDQFLYIVQTAILANGINLSSQADSEKYRHEFSATGVLGMLNEAIRASERIPENMEAYDAAHEFCSHMLGHIQEAEEKASGKRLDVPYWFAR